MSCSNTGVHMTRVIGAISPRFLFGARFCLGMVCPLAHGLVLQCLRESRCGCLDGMSLIWSCASVKHPCLRTSCVATVVSQSYPWARSKLQCLMLLCLNNRVQGLLFWQRSLVNILSNSCPLDCMICVVRSLILRVAWGRSYKTCCP